MKRGVVVLSVISWILMGLYAAPFVAAITVDANTVALWLFDEGSGDIAKDSSSYGNHGEIVGGAEWVDGKFDKALSFNGKDAYVKVPGSDSLKIADAITIEFWLFPRSFVGEWEIVRKHTGSYDYSIYADGSGIEADLNRSLGRAVETSIVIGGKEIPLDEWTHLAFTYDGEKIIMYINGNSVFEETAPGKIPTSDTPLYIGCRDGTRRFIDGVLDEFCLSNVARTADEIKAHIEEGVISPAAVEKVGKLAVTWGALREE